MFYWSPSSPARPQVRKTMRITRCMLRQWCRWTVGRQWRCLRPCVWMMRMNLQWQLLHPRPLQSLVLLRYPLRRRHQRLLCSGPRRPRRQWKWITRRCSTQSRPRMCTTYSIPMTRRQCMQTPQRLQPMPLRQWSWHIKRKRTCTVPAAHSHTPRQRRRQWTTPAGSTAPRTTCRTPIQRTRHPQRKNTPTVPAARRHTPRHRRRRCTTPACSITTCTTCCTLIQHPPHSKQHINTPRRL